LAERSQLGGGSAGSASLIARLMELVFSSPPSAVLARDRIS